MASSNHNQGRFARILSGLFFLLFGAVFAGAGLLTLVGGLGADGQKDAENSDFVAVVIGGIFLLIGLAIMALGVFVARRSKAAAELESAQPDAPWLWRDDWRNGLIKSHQRATIVVFGVFTIIWNAISWTIAPLVIGEFQKGNKPALIALLFPLVGTGLLIALIVMILRARRFGTTILKLDSIPGVIGGSLRGQIICSNPFTFDTELKSRLTCVNIIRTGSGKNSSTRENLLFETQKRIDPESIDFSSAGMTIPVTHVIPFGLPDSDSSNSRNRMIWRLELKADLDGPDFVQRFEVPVFKTADSDESVREETEHSIDLEAAHARGLLFENSKIGFTKLENGAIEVYFPAARNKGAILAFGIFAIIWGGVIYGLSFSDAPLLFPIVFGFFELIFLVVLVNMLFSSSLLHIRPDGLGFEKRIMGFSKRGFHAPRTISKLDCEVSMQSGSRVYYRLILKLKSERQITLGSDLPEKSEALALIAAAEEVLGLRPQPVAAPSKPTF